MRLFISMLLGLGIVAAGSWFGFAPGAKAGGGGACHSPLTEGATTTIEIAGYCYGPMIARVEPGSTVTWINLDAAQHDVYAPGQDWSKRETLLTGSWARATFEAAGVFPYVCSLHPGMVGVVIVGDGVSATAAMYDAVSAPAVEASVPAVPPSQPAPMPALMQETTASDGDGGAAIAVAGIAAIAVTAGIAAVGLVVSRRLA